MFLSDLPPPLPSAETIVVTASLAPQERDETPASVSLITTERTERLGEPLLASLLRLTPSAALSIAGPAGSLTQLRLRGAEANHTLLFVNGIRANDPAAGNEPRFELLSADLGDRCTRELTNPELPRPNGSGPIHKETVGMHVETVLDHEVRETLTLRNFGHEALSLTLTLAYG